ncbi:uncharacterized mitochondrial protein AtMg00810-like [Aristolochia californica]|uniref:uncharacterized mitochondrial protein AtMg00810-like n=1 Tax=Aristolochia californica TaxID=171875 RepID=UPI0035E1965C
MVLLGYVDDIIMSGSDEQGIEEVKIHLAKYFQTKDLARNKTGLVVTEREYVTNMLQEYDLLGAKPGETPMKVRHDLHNEQSEELKDKTVYRHLVGKLIYATVTRPDISSVDENLIEKLSQATVYYWEGIYTGNTYAT